MRVLVADDDRVVSLLLCSVLRKRGHEVTAALDFAQTYAAATATPAPEVIVLDLNMPDAIGLDAPTALRENPATRHIPVIAISGTIDEGIDAAVRALGVVDVLTKPVSPATLAAALERVTP